MCSGFDDDCDGSLMNRMPQMPLFGTMMAMVMATVMPPILSTPAISLLDLCRMLLTVTMIDF